MRQAPVYYAAAAVSTVVAVLASAIGVSPIRVLFIASGLRVAGWVVTGVISVLSNVYLDHRRLAGFPGAERGHGTV